MCRVGVYVDGFNLYNGIHEAYGRTYLWLDVVALSHMMLAPGQELASVAYFTARVRRHREGRLRQVTYLEALAAHRTDLRIVEGRFQQQSRACRVCGIRWTTHQEKETDVNIAVSLVEDAAFGRYDVALLISGDSDLCPAIRAVQRVQPGVRVVSVFRPLRRSDPLARVADGVYSIGRDKLRRAQLPVTITTGAGIKLTRPPYWS